MDRAHERYALYLAAVFFIVFILLAIKPLHPSDWLLENILTVIAIILLFCTARKFPLSRISYTLIFIFLCMHEVGSHYTYAEVPYDQWFESIFGRTLNSLFGWERNHYDRLVHFNYGLLLAYPIFEVFHRIAQVRGFWAYFLPLDITMSTSMLYELIEWAAAMVVGGELGQAYLGTQGDIWDAHKDMGLASLGALLAMLITLGISRYLQEDFVQEWRKSLSVKERRPLGEYIIKKLLKDRKHAGEK
ncbi:DUF2238 domain-containing protein [candidate division KSB1 bacterium]